MEVVEFVNKNGILVSADDRAFNAEIEAALIKDGAATYSEKFRVKCNPVYEKTQRWKILTTDYDNEIHDYINSIKGRFISYDTDFDTIMRQEGLQALLGSTRITRIIFETKEYTNGRVCEPCEC